MDIRFRKTWDGHFGMFHYGTGKQLVEFTLFTDDYVFPIRKLVSALDTPFTEIPDIEEMLPEISEMSVEDAEFFLRPDNGIWSECYYRSSEAYQKDEPFHIKWGEHYL